MRFWDVSGPDVDAADAEPWDGPLAGAMRPFGTKALVRVVLAAGLLYFLAGACALVPALFYEEFAAHPTLLASVGVYSVAVGLGMFVLLSAISPRMLRRYFPALGLVTIGQSPIVVTMGLFASGPSFGVAAAVYVEALLFAFYMLRLRWALAAAVLVLAGFGLLVALQDGWDAPLSQWIVLSATATAAAAIMGLIAERADELGASEHEARMELADLNHTLEDRVEEQVTEIERLGELRRFLPPQVADALLSGDSDAVTRPHRQRIAVFFCDLRGFTAFTRDSEPEEVMAILGDYYRTVGALLQRSGATIGGYAGDGIMAYLGDPVPHPEPARAAVRMVSELRGEMTGVLADWRRRGYDLDYGVGLAFGYATLGVVGFDGRYDYTPMGGVVNLAARLCSKAAGAQVLLDHATYAELDDQGACEPVDGLDLKGFGAQRAYALA